MDAVTDQTTTQKTVGDPRRPLTKQGFALATGYTVRQVGLAIRSGDVRTVSFGGRDWIPWSEADRVNTEKAAGQKKPDAAAEHA